MEKRLRWASRWIQAGCFLFFLYGIFASIFAREISLYQFTAFSGETNLDNQALEFSQSLVLIIGLMGAGLALASGILFRVGIQTRSRLLFLSGLISGAIGVFVLLTVHLHQRAWLLFIADNVCLTVLSIGLNLGAREIFNLIRGAP